VTRAIRELLRNPGVVLATPGDAAKPAIPALWDSCSFAAAFKGPYPSLFLLAAPLAIVELLKLAAVFVLGKGHWLAGTAVMLSAYATSAFLIERLFRIVKPKLLTLSWFEWTWTKFVAIRDKIGRRLWNRPRSRYANRLIPD
jgi:hypothetical protein